MNSGLPSLLDAIFGKENLALVSLDEINEVIQEFPSFNAGHFLLAKKLKLQEDPGYEMESMRTALYFNNPFWLQSLLDDADHFQPEERQSHKEEERHKDQFIFEEYPEEDLDDIQQEGNYTFGSYTPVEQPVAVKDESDNGKENITDEKPDSGPIQPEEKFQYAEPGSQTVTSFDELMAKYHIQPLDLVDESTNTPGPDITAEEIVPPEPEAVQTTRWPADEAIPDKSQVIDASQQEMLEEVVNEYGIFEEIPTKKTDQDDDEDAFDQELDQIPFVSEKILDDQIPAGPTGEADHSANADHIVLDKDNVNSRYEVIDAEESDFDADAGNSSDETENEHHIALDSDRGNINKTTATDNYEIIEHDSAAETEESADEPHQTDEHDYEAFDRTIEEVEQAETEVKGIENPEDLSDYDPDIEEGSVEYSDDIETGANGELQELSERFGESQKLLSSFNAKNADSIVFTPYHMVDYFASQGIKLVLEDNPPDQFGKQLKSFTDWLKVMKKVPPHSYSEKQDEKENERIRHFAAHSIEDRDILTESMAEVLAKQGMYENAIALFQKLSLIYPPKSAYFASRIEELKASLP
jgi:hypothetical protein